MATDRNARKDRWQRWLGLLLLVLPVVLLLVPLFQFSENLHTREETTSWERMTLGLRTFWPQPTSSIFTPSSWLIDTNVPLGSAVLFAIPHGLDLDALVWSREFAAIAAVIATLGVFRLLEPSIGGLAAALAAIWPWSVPGFCRGAVVSGEETLFAAAVVLAVLGLVEGRRGLILSVLAANSMVLFRLDAAIVLPGYALLAFALRPRREAFVLSGLSGLSALLHVGTTWATTGHPLTFAKTAQRVTEATSAGGASLTVPGYIQLLADSLGGAWVLALALLGVVLVAWRGDRRSRSLAAITVWVMLAYGVVGHLGIIKLHFVRYLIPVLLLLSACAGAAFGIVAGRWRVALPLLGGLLLGLSFHANVPVIAAQAEAARLPPGVEGAAHWFAACGLERTVLVSDHPFAFSVLGPIRPERVIRVKTRLTTPNPSPILEQLEAPDASYLAIVGSGPVEQLIRETRAPGWHFVWQEHAVTVYARVDDAERQRLLECSRWN